MVRQLPDKDHQTCSLFWDYEQKKGERFDGKLVIKAMTNMKVRGNGLGAGFAAYGIHPKYKEFYTLQF